MNPATLLLSIAIGAVALMFVGRSRALKELPDDEAAELAMQAWEGTPPERNFVKLPPVGAPAGSVEAEMDVRLARRGVRLTESQRRAFRELIPMLTARVV